MQIRQTVWFARDQPFALRIRGRAELVRGGVRCSPAHVLNAMSVNTNPSRSTATPVVIGISPLNIGPL